MNGTLPSLQRDTLTDQSVFNNNNNMQPYCSYHTAGPRHQHSAGSSMTVSGCIVSNFFWLANVHKSCINILGDEMWLKFKSWNVFHTLLQGNSSQNVKRFIKRHATGPHIKKQNKTAKTANKVCAGS